MLSETHKFKKKSREGRGLVWEIILYGHQGLGCNTIGRTQYYGVYREIGGFESAMLGRKVIILWTIIGC